MSSRVSSSLVFCRLFWPHPLPPEQVAAFFTRLASDRHRGVVVTETRAHGGGIAHLLGAGPADMDELRRLLTDMVPGTLVTALDGYVRTSMYSAGKVTARPSGLPLKVQDPRPVVRAVHAALARPYQPGEAVTIQLVLGPGRGPQTVPAKIADPRTMGLWRALMAGHQAASAETRRQVREKADHAQVDCTLRIAVTAASSDKRRRMALALLAALRVAQAPGVRLHLAHEDPNAVNTPARPRWYTTRLAVPELVAVCGWPVGDEHLPGMPPPHPKMLRAEAGVHTGPRVFARSLVPGDNRHLGVAPADALFHGFVLGPTGVGKTTALLHLMEADIDAGHAVLALDPKDQIPAHLLARVPRRRWKDVVVIDAADPDPVGFNPLDATGRDPDVVADAILAVFCRVFADGWGPRTADIFSASLRTLARTGRPERPSTLIDLPRLWTDPAFRRTQVAAVSGDVALSGFWAWYEALGPTQQMGVIAAPMNKLRAILLRPAAVKILGQARPPFRLRDMFREAKIVLVPLNEGLIGPLTAELLGSLVIAEVWQATQERASEPGHDQRPGFVYVDEADRFMHLPVSLADALARSRSLSVSWCLAAQFWDQLPKDMKAAVKSNARSKIVFRLESDEDARTLARLAPELTETDFMALDRYQVYIRLVADGVTTGWALAQTLPPSPPRHDPAQVLRAARAHHRPMPISPSQEAPPDDLLGPAGTDLPADEPTGRGSPVLPTGPIGRRRRHP